MNTYISTDGGHNWKEIKKGVHVYEIGDRGGIIVLGSQSGKTSSIHYSWDLGLTWKTLQISEEKLDIIDILTEHSNISQKFLIFAKYQSSSGSYKTEGKVIQIDFAPMHKRQCEG